MNDPGIAFRFTARQARLVLVLGGLSLAFSALGRPAKVTFDVLQVGASSYTNVTVTSKTDNHVFVTHAAGVAGIRVSDLPSDALIKLGYAVPAGKTNLTATGSLLRQAAQQPGRRFPVLEIGDETYTNAVVTSVSSNSVAIEHAGGIAQVKVAHLPIQVRTELGFKPDPPKAVAGPVGIEARVARQLAKYQSPIVGQLERSWYPRARTQWTRVLTLSRNLLFGASALILLGYLLFCRACFLICRNAHISPGPLVWFPILQILPLLRAADMSWRWFLLTLVPGLNAVVYIVWSIRVSRTCGKSGLMALFLIVPLTSFLAFLYLAFAGSGQPGKEPAPPVMRLGVAS